VQSSEVRSRPAATRLPWWGAAAFLLPFALYSYSLAPDVAYWDTAEMQTVPYIFGIAHPTGFPVFVFLGWLFSHAIPIGTVAWRISLMTAVAMAGAAWLVYATVVDFGESELVGLGGALLFATGEVVWSRGSRAEVHTFAVAFAALVIWQLLRYYRTGSVRALYVGAFAFGLAVANHGIASLLVPGIAMLVLPRIRDLGAKRTLIAIGLAIVPVLLYAYIPLRGMYLFAHNVDPTLALGLPAGRPFWDFEHPVTLPAFLHFIGGGDSSQVGTGFGRMFSLESYPAVSARFFEDAMKEFGLPALIFTLLGIALVARRQPWIALSLFVICGTCIPYGLLYPESDQDRYLLTAYWGVAVFAAVGASRALLAYAGRAKVLAQTATLLVLFGSALALFLYNRPMLNQRQDPGSRALIERTVASTPDDAILVANWTYATSLGYAAYVDHTLGHRVVVVAFPADYSYLYPGWLKKNRRIFLVNQPQFDDPAYDSKIASYDPAIIELTAK
jgi:Protein of unknown function (DUF2723)